MASTGYLLLRINQLLVYYNGHSFQLKRLWTICLIYFSDSFNSLLVTHTILDLLFVLIVRFADKDIEYYPI